MVGKSRGHIPQANPGIIHIVRRGDTLWRPARRYGTTEQAIMQANGLRSTRIYVGQQLGVALVFAVNAAGQRGVSAPELFRITD